MNIPTSNNVIQIYTDGSCYWKTGQGGIGVFIQYNNNEITFSRGLDNTKTGRSEMLAMICALKLVTNKYKTVIIHSDSQYVVNGINKWREGWRAKQYVGVKNEDLWRILDTELNKFPDNNISINWVKGHSGVYENEVADMLATEGRLNPIHTLDDRGNMKQENITELINNQIDYIDTNLNKSK